MGQDGRPPLLRLAVPLIVANLSIPLMGLVDTALLGHLPQPHALGAVALGGNLLSLALWSFGFLRMGTTGSCARHYGAGQHRQVRLLLLRSLAVALVLGGVLLLLRPLLAQRVLGLWVADAMVHRLAAEYVAIRLLAAPATLAIYCLVGWLLGLQYSRSVLLLMLGMNGMNMALDVWFIAGLGWGSRGAALASVAAEYSALALGLALVVRPWRRLGGGWPPLARLLRARGYGALLAVNRHLMVRTALLLGVFLFINIQGERLGPDTLAANAVLLSLLALVAYTLDGFVQAGETLVGNAWGARDWRRLQLVVRHGFAVVFAAALVMSALLLWGRGLVPGLFSDIPGVLAVLDGHYLWIALAPLAGFWSYQWDGVFIGSGQSRAMQYAMLLSVAAFLALWWLARPLANHGLWLAFHGFLAARALTLWAWWRWRMAALPRTKFV